MIQDVVLPLPLQKKVAFVPSGTACDSGGTRISVAGRKCLITCSVMGILYRCLQKEGKKFYIQQDSCSMRSPPAPASDECSNSRTESTTVQRAALAIIPVYVLELRILEGDSSKKLRSSKEFARLYQLPIVRYKSTVCTCTSM